MSVHVMLHAPSFPDSPEVERLAYCRGVFVAGTISNAWGVPRGGGLWYTALHL